MRINLILSLLFVSSFFAGCTGTENVDQILSDESGCTYPDAVNYNSSAVLDDGSCFYESTVEKISGCTYSDALNFNPSADIDDGSCRYPSNPEPILGCTYFDASNYNPNATKDDSSCIYDSDGDGIYDRSEIRGCTDSQSNNFNESATDDDGSCDYDEDNDGVEDWAELEGCSDSNATNFNPQVTDANNTQCEYGYTLNQTAFFSFVESDIVELFPVQDGKTIVKSWSVVLSEGEGDEIGGDTNGNTSGFEVTIGQDINTETLYSRILMRIAGDISLDQTTLQGPEGINYRTGNEYSGAWYYARDEIFQFENIFEVGEEEDFDDNQDQIDEPQCGEEGPVLDSLNSSWSTNWNILSSNNNHTITANNGTWKISVNLIGDKDSLKIQFIELEEINGLISCGIELLNPEDFTFTVNPNYPRTSITLRLVNEFEEESENTKTWSGEVSDEHSEEVNLDEIILQIVYTDDEGNISTATSMRLSQQSFTTVDECFQWNLVWTDADNNNLLSSNDTYSVTQSEKFLNPCSDDDDYRNKDFQIIFYDDWAGMPTGGVFTPGFGIIATFAAILIAFRYGNNESY
tara:strand:- start:2354 stop:4081 length:1728 start_codon:yes stop_codon:yes gene_type:complete